MAKQQQATQATQQPAQAAAKPAQVALRGGIQVAAVAMGSKPYRTTAPHNVAWFSAITQAIKAGNGSAAVQPLLATQANPNGVPAHFFGYCLRHNYLAQA